MKKVIIKSRRYCFTVNNYTQNDLEEFHILAESLEKHVYISYGLEIAPTTGTQHIQGYIELINAQRLQFLHNYFPFKKDGKKLKFHVEIANGSAEHNKKYNSKDNKFYEFGEPLKQGARTDLAEIKKKIKENPKNIKEIIEEHGNNLQQVRYTQILQPLFLLDRDPKTPPIVFWIFGASGIGKTKLVFKTFTDVCSVSSYDWLGTGYNQNECLLLDDFRSGNLSFETLLKLTDRYPYMLFYKGGQIPLNSPFIIFTSPKSISGTFSSTSEDLKQIKRRIVEINLDAIDDKENLDLRNLDEKYIYKNIDNCDSDW